MGKLYTGFRCVDGQWIAYRCNVEQDAIVRDPALTWVSNEWTVSVAREEGE